MLTEAQPPMPPVTLEAYQAALNRVQRCFFCGVEDAQTIREWVRIQTDCAARWQTACFEEVNPDDDE